MVALFIVHYLAVIVNVPVNAPVIVHIIPQESFLVKSPFYTTILAARGFLNIKDTLPVV